ncbi:MAG: cupin domain-containing protein [Mycobacteriales bacterium]
MTTIPSPTLFAVPREAVDRLARQPLPGGGGVDHRAVFLSDGTVAGQLRLGPGAREARHLHGHGEHHVWVLEGEVVVDGTRLPAGSYLHVPAHLMHQVEDGGAGSLLFYVFTTAGEPGRP